MSILGVQHVGTALDDFGGTWRACQDRLGLDPRDFRNDQGRGFQHDARVLLGNECWLHLVYNWRADARVSQYQKKRGPGLEHIALRVDSVESEVLRLRALGVPLWEDTILNAADGFESFIYPDDGIGFTIELIEPHATSWQYPRDAGDGRGRPLSARSGIASLAEIECAVQDVKAAAGRLTRILDRPVTFDARAAVARMEFGNDCSLVIGGLGANEPAGLRALVFRSANPEADHAAARGSGALLPFAVRFIPLG
jgi:hypothetical protein